MSARLATALALTGALLACAAPRDRFYVIAPLGAAPPPAVAMHPTAIALRVRVPPALDRAPLVVHTTAAQVQVLEHERWLGLPSEQIEAALARDLEARRPGLWVNAAGASPPAMQLAIDVTRMSVTADETVQLDAHWRISDGGAVTGSAPIIGDVALVEPVSSSGGRSGPDARYGAVATAFSRAVATLADRVAAALPR